MNAEGTLFVSGEIDDWEPLRQAKVDTIVDMDGDIDKGVPQSPNAILYVYYPILDEELPDCDKLHAVGRMVAELVQGARDAAPRRIGGAGEQAQAD